MSNSKAKLISIAAIFGSVFATNVVADVSSNTVSVRAVTPLANTNAVVVAVTPNADICGGKPAFYIRESDSANGKALVAAALTAAASGISVRPQVASADCGETWPTLSGLGLVVE